jgi:glycopeptide antibiotics resistance protein
MLKTPSSRRFSALLGYVMLIILLLTFNPFYLAWPEKLSFKFQSSFDNLILNVILFLPVGFLYRLVTRRHGALLLGEYSVLQWLPERTWCQPA